MTNEWILSSNKPDIERLRKRESLWTQGNGYMGIRSSFEEAYVNEHRTTVINGVFNAPEGEVTELAVIPDATNCEIEINGERFTMLTGVIEDYNASLNLKNGVMKRTLKWRSPKGTYVKIDFSRMVSDVKKHIIAQTITVTALEADVHVSVLTGIDGKVTNTGVQHFTAPQKRAYKDGINGLYVKTLQSNIDAALHFTVKCDKEHDSKTVTDRRSIYTKSDADIKKNESITFEKYSSYATSRDFEYINCEAEREKVIEDGKKYLYEAVQLGYEKLCEESSASWEKFFEECPVHINSNNEFLNKAVNFSLYHLYIMANRDDSRMGVGAKALSGEGYKGHSFWDTEIFILPYYIFSAPKTARNLLEYRYKLLDPALEKAKKYGYVGAMYPWEGAWIDDGEACPEFSDIDLLTGEVRKLMMGEIEVHISADIAYAVWQYYCATGDLDFMEKYGCEIIILTALFWTSRVVERNGRYEILNVIGPDEYKDDINNNAYTNYMAHYNLKLAQRILENCPQSVYDKLDKEYDISELGEKINSIIDKLYLPTADTDGIISQFDGYRDLKEIDTSVYKNLDKVGTIFENYGADEVQQMQVSKQADIVMLFYLMPELFDEEEIRKNFVYYEERTLHDSSLSMCIHALVSARLGMQDMAKKMFFDSCCVDVGDNTNNSDEGVHSASIGGIWLALVMGYGGLLLNDEKLNINPVLPEGWSDYTYTFFYQGTKIMVSVDNEGCSVKRISGKEVTVTVNGKETKI